MTETVLAAVVGAVGAIVVGVLALAGAVYTAVKQARTSERQKELSVGGERSIAPSGADAVAHVETELVELAMRSQGEVVEHWKTSYFEVLSRLERKELEHRRELEPLRRYADALRAGVDEDVEAKALFLQVKERVMGTAAEFLQMKRDLREARFWAHQQEDVYRTHCELLRVYGEKHIIEAKPMPECLQKKTEDG